MRDKRIKLIFFSLRGSEVKDYDLGWKKLLSILSMLSVILIILASLVVGLFSDLYHNSKISTLQKTNQLLKTHLGEMRKHIDKVTAQMEQFETDDDDQRLIVGLDRIDKDMRSAGSGGPSYSLATEATILPRETRDQISDIKIRIDQLERRMQILVESQSDIDRMQKENKEMFDHLPTINPVDGGRITDKFGNRIDPFIEKPKFHSGIDIAAPVGTKVYAAAYGVVELVNYNYRPNQDYGRYIVINHGYGNQTVYGHLREIYIKTGQKLKRWDIIGEVGETGRATGPHLHYEVRENETPVNPINYFFE